MSDDTGERRNIKAVDFKPGTISQAALAELERGLPDMLRLQRYAAKLHRAKFDACIDEGFTEPQALELCKLTRL